MPSGHCFSGCQQSHKCIRQSMLVSCKFACAAKMQFKTLSYPTLAFEFQYPVSTESGRKLPVIISRRPERYSSAAPMTADARQRIVTELVDFPDGITISVSVSPVFHHSRPMHCIHRAAWLLAASIPLTGLVYMLFCCLYRCVVSESSPPACKLM